MIIKRQGRQKNEWRYKSYWLIRVYSYVSSKKEKISESCILNKLIIEIPIECGISWVSLEWVIGFISFDGIKNLFNDLLLTSRTITHLTLNALPYFCSSSQMLVSKSILKSDIISATPQNLPDVLIEKNKKTLAPDFNVLYASDNLLLPKWVDDQIPL